MTAKVYQASLKSKPRKHYAVKIIDKSKLTPQLQLQIIEEARIHRKLSYSANVIRLH